MTQSLATAGLGTYLKRGDGGVGAGVQASRVFGTSNQKLKLLAKKAGAAGNSKTCAVVVSGTQSYAQVITANNVAITSASSSGTATTTVAQCISNLYQDPVFTANWQATVDDGNGSGVLVAGGSAALTGGSDGTEVFTTISEIRSLGGPQLSQDLIEVTNFSSPDFYREYIAGLLDSGNVTFDMNFTNVAAQTALIDDLEDRIRRNFILGFETAAGVVEWDFAAVVSSVDFNFQIEEAISASVSLKVTSKINRS